MAVTFSMGGLTYKDLLGSENKAGSHGEYFLLCMIRGVVGCSQQSGSPTARG